MIGEERHVPDAHGDGTTAVQVYTTEEGIGALNFGRAGGSLAVGVWTTLEGLAQIRDALTEALDAATEAEAQSSSVATGSPFGI